MGFKGLVAAAASIALITSPVLVSAQTATPAPERVSGMEQSDGGGVSDVFVWLAAAAAIGLLAWVILDSDTPASP